MGIPRKAAGAVAIGVLLSSCQTTPTILGKKGDGPVVLVGGGRDGGSDARVGGTLEVVAGHCLGVGNGGDAGAVVVWPQGTELVSTDPVLIQVDGQELGLGDEFYGGGGYLSSPYPEWVPPIPKDCEGLDVVSLDELE